MVSGKNSENLSTAGMIFQAMVSNGRNSDVDEEDRRKEYIEREALLKDISETVIFTVRGGTPLPNAEMRGANKVIDRVKSAKAADVVEVVRCEECRHSRRVEKGPAAGTYRCKLTKGYLWTKDDFCSYGERKEVECDGKVQTETM